MFVPSNLAYVLSEILRPTVAPGRRLLPAVQLYVAPSGGDGGSDVATAGGAMVTEVCVTEGRATLTDVCFTAGRVTLTDVRFTAGRVTLTDDCGTAEERR